MSCLAIHSRTIGSIQGNKGTIMLDIQWLNTFAVLARVEHFGKAALALQMTQPNVSLQIKQLEKTTGVKLIERKPFVLTYAGRRLLDTADKIISELENCQSDLNAINEQSQGSLTIAASDTISRLLLIAPFQLFSEEFPGIDLSLQNTTSAQATELVKSAKVDLGFVMAQKNSLPLHFTELHQVKWCAYGHGLDRWQKGLEKTSEPENILIDPVPTLIVLGHETRTRGIIDAALPLLGLRHYRVMEVGSVDAQIEWAEAGFGVAIVPEYSLQQKENIIAPITPLLNFPTTSLGYIVRQNQILSRATKRLLKWVAAEVSSFRS
jgi:DNA-binding transcriptional LysR family regulator